MFSPPFQSTPVKPHVEGVAHHRSRTDGGDLSGGDEFILPTLSGEMSTEVTLGSDTSYLDDPYMRNLSMDGFGRLVKPHPTRRHSPHPSPENQKSASGPQSNNVKVPDFVVIKDSGLGFDIPVLIVENKLVKDVQKQLEASMNCFRPTLSPDLTGIAYRYRPSDGLRVLLLRRNQDDGLVGPLSAPDSDNPTPGWYAYDDSFVDQTLRVLAAAHWDNSEGQDGEYSMTSNCFLQLTAVMLD